MHKLANTLVVAVLPIFGRLGVSQETLLTGQLLHTDLVWQVPPIMPDLTLNGLPLWELFDVPIMASEIGVYDFWATSMEAMRNSPRKVYTRLGYKGARTVMRASSGERQHWLSIPDGFPDRVTEFAGAIFSMECAHILKQAGYAKALVSTESDYYVETQSGFFVGVRDGLPIEGATDWDTSVKGLVPELLGQWRGASYQGCDYDLVSKLRSALWEHRNRVPEFEAVDMVMQALRVLSHGGTLPKLQHGVLALDTTKSVSRNRLVVLREAQALVSQHGASDRAKILGLREMLVPVCLNKTNFSKVIFPYNREVPAMLTAAFMRGLSDNLRELIHIEETRSAVKIKLS